MVQSYLERFGRQPSFPTEAHRAAAEAVVDHFALDTRVQAILLTCSCARGVASPASCVDITLLVAPADLEAFRIHERADIQAFLAKDPACVALAELVPWSGVDLEFRSGGFTPAYHGWTSGPDNYELEIGNILAWVHPMLLRGPRFEGLQASHLPYYDEGLRQSRLADVIRFAVNNLDHVLPFAERGLCFQAFKRLYHAFEEYLQALFIHRRIYPIAYDKWLREQGVEVLGEPALYEQLEGLLTLPALAPQHFCGRVQRLRGLLEDLIR